MRNLRVRDDLIDASPAQFDFTPQRDCRLRVPAVLDWAESEASRMAMDSQLDRPEHNGYAGGRIC